MPKRRLTYAEVEAHVAKRVSSFDDTLDRGHHHTIWQSTSFLYYVSPNCPIKSNRVSPSPLPIRSLQENRRNGQTLADRLPCSRSDQKILTTTELNAKARRGIPIGGRMPHILSASSSTVRSKQTLASTSTRIDQQEYLELADRYYLNPDPAHPRQSSGVAIAHSSSTCPPRDVPSETVREAPAVPWVQSRSCVLDLNLSHRTAQTDVNVSSKSIGITRDADLVSLNFSSLDGWLGYTRKSQSLHTIKGSDDDSRELEFTPNCSSFTQLEVADPSLIIASTSTTSMTSVTHPSSSMASVSCLGRVFRVFKRQKKSSSSSLRHLNPEPKHHLQSTGSTYRLNSQSGLSTHPHLHPPYFEAGTPRLSHQRRSCTILDNTISSTNGNIRRTRLPSSSSSSLGLGFDSTGSGHDLDYDYRLAVDVLVHGVPTYDNSIVWNDTMEK